MGAGEKRWWPQDSSAPFQGACDSKTAFTYSEVGLSLPVTRSGVSGPSPPIFTYYRDSSGKIKIWSVYFQ